MSLSSFMAPNAIKTENIRYIASKRFLNEHGAPEAWEIKCITSAEDEKLRKSCTNRVQVSGKRNQFVQETDYDLYVGKLAALCTVYPNLSDAALQDSYGVLGDDALLKAMLAPGEYADYLTKIQEVNSFDTTLEDEVDEAKNS